MYTGGEHAQFIHCLRLIGENVLCGRYQQADSMVEILLEGFDHHVEVFRSKVQPLLAPLEPHRPMVRAIERYHRSIRQSLLELRAGVRSYQPVSVEEVEFLFDEHGWLEREQLIPVLRHLWSLNLQGLDDLPLLDVM